MTNPYSDELEMRRRTERSRLERARSVYNEALKSSHNKTNPFFAARVYALVRSGVCDNLEEVTSHADR